MCHVEQVTRSTHNQCCVLYLHASRSLLCGNAYMYQYEVLVHVRVCACVVGEVQGIKQYISNVRGSRSRAEHR